MSPRQKILRCPTCNTLVTAKDEHFPFCSEHCQSIDLGKWASGVYRISSPILDPEVLEGLSENVKQQGNDDE